MDNSCEAHFSNPDICGFYFKAVFIILQRKFRIFSRGFTL